MNKAAAFLALILSLAITACQKHAPQEVQESHNKPWTNRHTKQQALTQTIQHLTLQKEKQKKQRLHIEKQLTHTENALAEAQIKWITLKLHSLKEEIANFKTENEADYIIWLQQTLATLFLEERKELTQIIEAEGKHAQWAQQVFDNLLRTITYLSEDKNE